MNIPDNMMIGSLSAIQPAEETKQNSDLDMEQFLQIISSAMSMPSFDGQGSGGGGSETDYIGQMVQFGMLNAMEDLNTSMQTTMLMSQQQQALGLVGKQVTLAGEEAQLISGPVEKVRFDNGYATLQVNGAMYQLNDVIEVSE
ncbi:flagellar basal-body rod modification protein FlgD [Alkalibacterium subtropicum]|uniref:Flagellar basal-body rod modification protein FlgD n=1 Tax=Alkalibacterium subtropicum TaxID=753702 RepID=A0A1I1J132_9LACT|nr:FLgD tudor-like domain-containing protein [Alkalibacterium subtropicum]SFC40348.1 flagellar basal-body rod modification protein FlgD [Alkalibacterium subtropicum]